MKLWLISQEVNPGYDTFDAAIVAADTEADARLINPEGEWRESYSSWAMTPEQVTVKLIGEAAQGIEAGVVLASFNAG